MNALIALSLLLGVAFASTEERNETVTTCNGNPCPAHTVVNTYADGVEERKYDEFTVPTYSSVPCLTWNAAQSQGYFHLSMYTRYSSNADHRQLKMGVPVLLEVKNVADVEERCSHIYSTSFYIDEEDLPKPTNPQVKLKQMSELSFYAITFNGILRNPSDRVLELRVKLNALGLCYDTSLYYIASYSSPNSLLNTKTEVLIPVRQCE